MGDGEGAGTSFSLELLNGSQTVVDYGTFPAPAGHSSFDTAVLLKLMVPNWLAAGSDYLLSASIQPGGAQVQSFPFTILRPNAVKPSVWLKYS